MSEDLILGDGLAVPADELRWSFGPSGGPGGQHANRSNTRAELRFDLAGSPSIPDDLRPRMLAALEQRLVAGSVVVVVDESRSQWRNRQIARRRLADLLVGAARPPAPSRKRTRPGRAARERRLETKRRRSETKRLRRKPDAD